MFQLLIQMTNDGFRNKIADEAKEIACCESVIKDGAAPWRMDGGMD
jgi:hypothetical protein